ncbi:MAG TPA: hypothetical protein VF846_22605, partial [Thermoanaerobaculia bacterium]
AATLLLPYFEVAEARLGETTLFTVTNVSDVEQIARVTLWTDLSYPVITFDIYLTGYDVQSVNLYDVIMRGRIGGARGTGKFVSPAGEHAHHNAHLQTGNCGEVPPDVPESVLAKMQSALIEGTVAGCKGVGHAHENAVGYATIDLVRNCVAGRGPADPRYWTEDILFNNVLIGDYLQVNRGQNFAQGNPMVHIRAIPDGGSIRERKTLPARRMPFKRTFYSRFQDPSNPTADGRQPLPTMFAARWINGGTGYFETWLKIWREPVTGTTARCADYANNSYSVYESVSFDDDENGEGIPGPEIIVCCVFGDEVELPSTSLIEAGDEDVLPQNTFDDSVSGWIYFNLDSANYTQNDAPPRQGWIALDMRAEARYSVSFDAAYLGNGCSPSLPTTEFTEGYVDGVFPGPAEDVNP